MYKIILKLLFASYVLVFISLTSFANNIDLIDIEKLNKEIKLDIRYATKNNFTGKVVYPEAKCFLREEVANKLNNVQLEISKNQLSLKVYDCYRPLSAQRKFWELLPDERYVANPKYGSRHNRGAAVDLTIVDQNGNELPMPTGYDDFTEKAHRNYMKLTEIQIKNRTLLEKVMEKHGFKGLKTEWWHFDYKNWKKYEILNIDFSEISKNK